MATTEKFRAAKERMRAAKAEAAKIAQDAFKEGAADLFAAHSRLESFGWRQYTPYFNDGDTCEFGVNIDYPEINGDDENDSLREFVYRSVAGKYEKVANEGYDAELGAANKAVKEFLASFDEDDFKEMFGDHMKITVSRNGELTTEQYDHD
jgi:hypothetical protein